MESETEKRVMSFRSLFLEWRIDFEPLPGKRSTPMNGSEGLACEDANDANTKSGKEGDRIYISSSASIHIALLT